MKINQNQLKKLFATASANLQIPADATQEEKPVYETAIRLLKDGFTDDPTLWYIMVALNRRM